MFRAILFIVLIALVLESTSYPVLKVEDSDVAEDLVAPEWIKLVFGNVEFRGLKQPRASSRIKKWDYRVQEAPVGAAFLQAVDILQHDLRQREFLRQLERNENLLKFVG